MKYLHWGITRVPLNLSVQFSIMPSKISQLQCLFTISNGNLPVWFFRSRFGLVCHQTQIFFLTIVLGLNLLFFRYLSKIDAPAHLRLYFKHICVVLLFSDFPGKLPLCCKRERFWVISTFLPPGSGQFYMFLTYVIKVGKREVFRLYFKHICVVSLFIGFPGKLPLCRKRERFWVISIF